jgi:hypothetical protein
MLLRKWQIVIWLGVIWTWLNLTCRTVSIVIHLTIGDLYI